MPKPTRTQSKNTGEPISLKQFVKYGLNVINLNPEKVKEESVDFLSTTDRRMWIQHFGIEPRSAHDAFIILQKKLSIQSKRPWRDFFWCLIYLKLNWYQEAQSLVLHCTSKTFRTSVERVLDIIEDCLHKVVSIFNSF